MKKKLVFVFSEREDEREVAIYWAKSKKLFMIKAWETGQLMAKAFEGTRERAFFAASRIFENAIAALKVPPSVPPTITTIVESFTEELSRTTNPSQRALLKYRFARNIHDLYQ